MSTTDRLHPTAPTWQRVVPDQPMSIDDHPRFFRDLAEIETDPRLAESWREMADKAESVLIAIGRVPCSS